MTPYPRPALFPPADGGNYTWPAPNYIDPEERTWAAPASLVALFSVTSAIFCARIWARFRIARTSGTDDWFIIAAMPVLLGLLISTVLALREYGFNLHIYDQTPRTLITVRQITLSMEIIYIIATTLIKISILMFYRRITSSLVSRGFLIAVWTSILFVAAWGIASTFALLFTCWPVEAYWYRFTTSWLRTHKYKCHEEIRPLIAIISISTAQDLIVCILPMFLVAKLRLPPRQKFALAGLFLIGLGTCAIGALRIHFAHRVYYYTKLNPSPTYDITWEALGSWVSTSVEANIGVICACVPALRVYFPRWLCASEPEQRTFGWYRGSHWRIHASSSAGDSGKASTLIELETPGQKIEQPQSMENHDTERIEPVGG